MAVPPTRAEFLLHGPPPEVWAKLARKVSELDLATDTFRLESHGLVSDHQVIFSAGPAVSPAPSSLPDGLSPFQVYYAQIISPSLFKVSTSSGGAPVNVGPGEGTAGLLIEIDLGPTIDHHIAMATAEVLHCLDQGDWDPPPGGWGTDVAKVILNRAMWPCLDSLGYSPPEGRSGTEDDRSGFAYRYKEAGIRKDLWCEGKQPPIGVIVPAPNPGDIDLSNSAGSTGWGDGDRGYGGRLSYLDRRRPGV